MDQYEFSDHFLQRKIERLENQLRGVQHSLAQYRLLKNRLKNQNDQAPSKMGKPRQMTIFDIVSA